MDRNSIRQPLVAAVFRACFALLIGASAGLAQTPDAAGLEFFESKIRPVLVNNCYTCHSREAKTAMGGLQVDTREGIRRGGQSGDAIVPGSVDDSLLIAAIRHDGELKMPRGGRLSDDVVNDFVSWVKMGAPDPREDQVKQTKSFINVEKGREFWAFQAPKRAALPTIEDLAWPRGDIDQFVLARLEEKGLAPVGDASKQALLRRLTFDLTGLPPTPADIDAFLADDAPNAISTVVDRLLASPHFGERWGRHWLDVARYADTVGRTRNYPFPVAWKYRNYVIDSFNSDKPYDEFITEQIAGDLLTAASESERIEHAIATGFLALGAHDLNEIDRKQFPMDVVDEMINVTSRSFMAVSVGCARCHDHKFDPIPTTDYYAMAGIFRSSELYTGLRQRPRFNGGYFRTTKLIELKGVAPYSDSNAAEVEAQRQILWEQLLAAEEARDRPEVRRIVRELDKVALPENLAMGIREAKKSSDCEVNIGGDPHTLGDRVSRGFVQVVFPADATLPAIGERESGRLQLAEWLTRRDNPLTARVMVNRVWHHLFGRGLVKTVDNFGLMGGRPTHPELLDYLAIQFMEQDWSVKSIIRQIVLSRAYQLDDTHHAENFEADPDNELLWRRNRRRLEVEALRDSLLQISGELHRDPPSTTAVHRWPRNAQLNGRGKTFQPWELQENFRSVYLPIVRNHVSSFYQTFDFPEPSETHGAREVTTVATQALFLLNNDFVLRQANSAAERLAASIEGDEQRVRHAYQQVLSRAPTPEELAKALEFVNASAENYAPPRQRRKRGRRAEPASAGQKEQFGWSRLYHALFTSAEFRYRS